MKPTLQQKYDFLLSKLGIQCIDTEESDAILVMQNLYFQFPLGSFPTDKDQAVEQAMEAAKFDTVQALRSIKC